MSENIHEKKEFTYLHKNDRTVYEMLKNISNLPMNNSLRYPIINMIKDYEFSMAEIAPDITEQERQLLLDDNKKLAIESYCNGTNFPYGISKKVIEQAIIDLNK